MITKYNIFINENLLIGKSKDTIAKVLHNKTNNEIIEMCITKETMFGFIPRDEDGWVVYNGYLDCKLNSLTTLPNKLHVVGSFDCSFNDIETLPNDLIVTGDFDCSFNMLSNLPSNMDIDGDIYCHEQDSGVILRLPLSATVNGQFINVEQLNDDMYDKPTNENLLKGVSKNDAMDSLNNLEPYERLSMYYEYGLIDKAKEATKDADFKNDVIEKLKEYRPFIQLRSACTFGLIEYFIELFKNIKHYDISEHNYSDMFKGAIKYGHYDIVKYLVVHNEINGKDLWNAVFYNQIEMVKLILDSNIIFNNKTSIKAMLYAASNKGYKDVLNLLSNSDKITNHLSGEEIKKYNDTLNENLLKGKSGDSVKNTLTNMTPLNQMINLYNTRLYSYANNLLNRNLFKKNLTANIKKLSTISKLEYSSLFGLTDLFKETFKDIYHILDVEGVPPNILKGCLMSTVKGGHLDIVEYLTENYIYSYNLFYYACELGRIEIVKYLINNTKYADDDYYIKNLNYAIKLAKKNNHTDIIKLIEDTDRYKREHENNEDDN